MVSKLKDKITVLSGTVTCDCYHVVVLICAISIAFFLAGIYPIHDARYVYSCFYYSCSNFLEYGTLPLWMPNIQYGESFYGPNLIFSLAPHLSFAAIIGYLLHIDNVYVLYILGQSAAYIVFGSGIYQLSKFIYGHSTISVVIAVCGMLLPVPYFQPWTMIFIGMPYFMFFFMKFALYDSRFGICASLLALIAWAVNSVPYSPPFIVFVSLFFCLTLIFSYKISIRRLVLTAFNSFKNYWVLWFVFILTSVMLVAYAMTAFEEVTVVGRNTEAEAVSLHEFLTYAGNITFGTLLEYINPSYSFNNYDTVVYISYIAVAMILFTFFIKNNKHHILFFLTGYVIIMFSVGGLVSVLVYYVIPGMNVYRHIGYGYTFASLMLLLVAGFGVRGLYKYIDDDSVCSAKSIALVMLITFSIFDNISLRPFLLESVVNAKIGIAKNIAKVVIYSFPVILTLVMIFSKRSRYAKKVLKYVFVPALLLLMVGDIAMYQARLIPSYYNPLLSRELLDLRQNKKQPVTFVSQRNSLEVPHYFVDYPPDTPLVFNASYNVFTLLFGGDVGIFNSSVYERINTYSHFGFRFFSDLGIPFLNAKDKYDSFDKSLLDILGHTRNKFYAVPISDAIEFKTPEESFQYIRNNRATLNNKLVLRKAHFSKLSREKSDKYNTRNVDLGAEGMVLLDFRPNEIALETNFNSDMWVVYADAYSPNWNVSINGDPQEMYIAYEFFKAVYLPAGPNVVKLEYSNRIYSIISHSLFLLLGFITLFFILYTFGAIFFTKLIPPSHTVE